MTRDQAEEIHRHLRDAVMALSRVQAAITEAGPSARKALGGHLFDVGMSLHFGLLETIYQKFPDLEPPAVEVPTIDSELTWDEISLPSSITENDLDEMILSVLTPQWRKMAAVLTYSEKLYAELAWSIDAATVAARIQVLADDNRIEHRGDLRKWRFSEVRLKP